MVIAKNSSVMKKDMRKRWIGWPLGSIRWLMAVLISRYRALATKVITAIVKSPDWAAITRNPAYSPAEALHSRLDKSSGRD